MQFLFAATVTQEGGRRERTRLDSLCQSGDEAVVAKLNQGNAWKGRGREKGKSPT